MEKENGMNRGKSNQLTRYLSPLSVWALSFGCAVGWGAFVMPGTTFLPAAGPMGTAIGIVIGAIVMLIIGMNYHYLINRYPGAGGTLTYTIQAFGYDHGFLSAWFLVLVYLAIIWANATALTLIGRYLFGNLFQFGFHYQILEYDIYMGEILLTMAAIVIFGLVCIYGKKLAVWIQIILALLLIGGIVTCFFMVSRVSGGGQVMPAFSANGKLPIRQIFTIVALSPWAFVGFESVSNSAAGFKFSTKKIIWIMIAALITGALSYILLTKISVSVLPDGYTDWTDYIKDIANLEGLKGLPAFFVVNKVMGHSGTMILGLAAASGIITGLVGNYIAASRLIYTMSEDGILPSWFGRVNEDGSPYNALLFLVLISLPIPFLGRTALGWIVDVNTVGATIAYAYTSAAAFASAKREGNKKIEVTGLAGFVMSVIFFFYFMASSTGTMATESYLILASWSILGFVYFRYMFAKDEQGRYGKSTIVWIGLLFLIFFTSLMWVKQATDEMTESVVDNISQHYEQQNENQNPDEIAETEVYLEEQLVSADRLLTRNSLIQMILIIASLAIMFSIYTTITKREKQMEVEKFKAEESSKAKSIFLSNMSHDIRTPMNAIIGYTNLAKKEENTLGEVREYLNKIEASSQHLLALINDVLEMSRIESGKMDLEPIEVDLKKTLREVKDMFATQMEEKQIEFFVDCSQIRNRRVLCDKNRLNRVLLNLLSNSYKFTPEEGTISVTLWQIEDDSDEFGKYELRVEDSGIGMSPEFAARVFDEFERERTSTVSGIQGTGLGMAITKSIVELMGGTIDVVTAPDLGTEFIIQLKLKLQSGADLIDEKEDEKEDEKSVSLDFSEMRLLLVEDNEINREIAEMILEEAGFSLDTAENGKEAVEKVAASEPGYFDAVLMDIQMPIMNGYDATKEIRSLEDLVLSKIPIIAMTANAFSEDIKMVEEVGMNAHIAKPLDVAVMMKTLEEVLQAKRKE